MKHFAKLSLISALFLLIGSAHSLDVDPYIWLEDATAPAAVAWADQQSQSTLNSFQKDVRYKTTVAAIHDLVYSPDRLPAVSYFGGKIYNFWQDQAHPHGIYRRTSVVEFAKAAPAWELLFDLDALAAREKTNWVWKGATCLEPQFERCLIALSQGGKDAVSMREFDLSQKQFVSDGFSLPEAKSQLTWIDPNNVFVATDFGAGSQTQSGYPRILKRWRRGQPLSQAKPILQATVAQLSVSGMRVVDGQNSFLIALKSLDFMHSETFLLQPSGKLKLLPFPTDAEIEFGLGGFAFIFTKSEWTLRGHKFPVGALLAWRMNQLQTSLPEVIFQPTATAYLSTWQLSGSGLYLALLNNVQGELQRLRRHENLWVSEKIAMPPMGTVSLGLSHKLESDLLLKFQSFLMPPTYYILNATLNAPATAPTVLKSSVARFNADLFMTEQFQSISKDGTKIPYFVVHAKDLKRDSSHPTLLYGYGGFEDSQTPFYSATIGRAWLEKGGVFVVANIRGGSEFGPVWHTSVLKENRQKIFADFISVAEDLIARQITTPARLGIQGGSNGGLLVGATFVQRPELFNAVVCEVPLLDMIRYQLIGAGASWQAEYGDPQDPLYGPALLAYSPYQNIKRGDHYPKVLLKTSRTDDRVGPGHARKMAAKMLAFGHEVLFFEDPEGGHGGGDNLSEVVTSIAVTYTYLYQQLMP